MKSNFLSIARIVIPIDAPRVARTPILNTGLYADVVDTEEFSEDKDCDGRWLL